MATTTAATGQDVTESRTSALSLMALGRVILAGISLAAPRGFAKVLGVTPSPELTYMTRIYGARAFAMGLGYLTSGAAERHRWKRLALVVDTTDTVNGVGHLVRRDLPLRAALSMVALTGTYAAIGATKVATEQLR
ncbi:hypothetical protein EHH44_08545 [Mycolicibacter terrae]|uniref:Aspartate carbamoyl transferase n=2 Tax=Mycolicibacter TaxID=1073531 RepID=A0A1A2P0R4_MYCSD|nr:MULTISPECIES: hypothetical protein [Mycolicibacter]OBH20928.1 hypothetical protein A5694_14695 [Mycolicibacter sinensis]OBI33615.1 hypothetical protein A5710_13325 [Mycolicibacter sinensis]RRR45922.1 hypothetical protein EHH44_08545 [Mycolicibacter terrae]